jgi:TolB protein
VRAETEGLIVTRIGAFVLGLVVALAATPPATAARPDGATLLPIEGLQGSLQNPCFSPDSRQLAITQWVSGYNAGEQAFVHVVERSPARLTARLGEPGTTSVNMPGTCWNATSGRIAYSADVGPDQVFTSLPDGSGVRQVTSGTENGAIEPTFSPDGSQIVFESHRYDSDDPGRLWIVNADGSGLRQLTQGPDDRQPVWSPKGDRIVFQRQQGGQWDVWTIAPDGSAPRNVTRSRALSETDASWSPSGTWLVYSGDGRNVDLASLFTIGADGAARQRLTKGKRTYDGAPSWSPDGASIAFESRRGEPDGSPGTRIFLIAAPTGRM